jgi:outer membrane protein assembly factor BamB
MPRFLLVGVAVTVAACGSEPVGIDRSLLPAIPSAAVVPNIHNVLSAIVSMRVVRADSVKVRFRASDAPGGLDSVTPAVAVTADVATVPILGLLPSHRYVVRPVAYGNGTVIVGDALDLKTGALPPDLPEYTASGSDPSAGYVLFAAAQYVVVIDNTGRVVWYRHFPNGAGLNFMAQSNGHYVLRPPTPVASDVEPWVELDPLGNVVRTLSCASGLQPRLHDLMLERDGSYRILCDETRTVDLTALGGVRDARVTGTVVQHIGPTGDLLFQWSPFDHFEITDLDAAERRSATVNWTHGNALDVDADGNLLLSFRSLGEITKIDAKTGDVIWRLGGRRNQFEFLDTPTPAFSRQHGVRVCAPGTLLLLDNIGDPNESRAERYVLDEVTHTARLAHSYGSAPRVVTEIGGSVQTLADGRTLVSFGTAGRVEEYDASGRLTWHIEGNPGYVFRAQRIRSLYAPGVGTSR